MENNANEAHVFWKSPDQQTEVWMKQVSGKTPEEKKEQSRSGYRLLAEMIKTRYLRGETLLLEPGEATREKGWILVCVDQYALGWGKLVNGVLKNKYWSGWRLKS